MMEMVYGVEVSRGREKLCGDCRESILLELTERNGRFIGVALTHENGLDFVGTRDPSPEARVVVDAVAEWTQRAEECHDHRTWLRWQINEKRLAISDLEAGRVRALEQAKLELANLERELAEAARRG